MADVIKKTTNKFTKGLIMDFSPENTTNEVLTHALNAVSTRPLPISFCNDNSCIYKSKT